MSKVKAGDVVSRGVALDLPGAARALPLAPDGKPKGDRIESAPTAAGRWDLTNHFLVVYVPPKAPPKVGDVYRSQGELNAADLPNDAVIVDGFGDAGRRRVDDDDAVDVWDFIDGGEDSFAIYPATLVWLPKVDE